MMEVWVLRAVCNWQNPRFWLGKQHASQDGFMATSWVVAIDGNVGIRVRDTPEKRLPAFEMFRVSIGYSK